MTTRNFVELPTGLRARVEALVETLIDLLDALDGDSDDEADADFELEPDMELDPAEDGIGDGDGLWECEHELAQVFGPDRQTWRGALERLRLRSSSVSGAPSREPRF